MYRAQSRSNHNVGGQNGPTQCVGQDQFGNKYYEDFDVKEINRWAEFNEYFDPYHTLGDRIPPAWHGQLAHVSNEAPTRTGYQYLQPATDNQSLPQGQLRIWIQDPQAIEALIKSKVILRDFDPLAEGKALNKIRKILFINVDLKKEIIVIVDIIPKERKCIYLQLLWRIMQIQRLQQILDSLKFPIKNYYLLYPINIRNRYYNLLIVTEIPKMGLGFPSVEIDINFDIPQNGKEYHHSGGNLERLLIMQLIDFRKQNNQLKKVVSIFFIEI
ncbi:unnamed protein product [Paramecium octaurelia]|uniref:NADH dehydrogenase [ubiquinone] 1 alpha subcomplex subunit 12 n=1 Tax=Paramecium octaurelia TaxID=43137 RepID=A0A8S1T250_PAROT|nr:unnamed protein product [Paramecium octaurelia]